MLNRIRGPFNLTGPAIAAGAAAIADTSHTDKAAAHNDTWLPWLTEKLEELGLQVTPSVAIARLLLGEISFIRTKSARELVG